MFYEDNNFLIGAVIGLVVGMLIIWFFRNWKDSRKPDLDAQIIRMRDKKIEKLEEKIKGDAITILNLTADNETMKQIQPLLKQEVKTLQVYKDKTKDQVKRFQWLAKVLGKLELKNTVKEVREEEANKKEKKDAQKQKTQEENKDLDALKNKSKGIATKPKGSPKQ